ncbi:MAG: hypothetical protein ACRDOU_33250 [Streptosporangiaceae bacterium]
MLAHLGHVVHEHRAGPALPVGAEVLVVVQAVEAKRAQLAGASPDTCTEFDGRPHRRSGQVLQSVQVARVEQLADHGLGQCPAGLVIAVRATRAFGASQYHVAGQLLGVALGEHVGVALGEHDG